MRKAWFSCGLYVLRFIPLCPSFPIPPQTFHLPCISIAPNACTPLKITMHFDASPF